MTALLYSALDNLRWFCLTLIMQQMVATELFLMLERLNTPSVIYVVFRHYSHETILIHEYIAIFITAIEMQLKKILIYVLIDNIPLLCAVILTDLAYI